MSCNDCCLVHLRIEFVVFFPAGKTLDFHNFQDSKEQKNRIAAKLAEEWWSSLAQVKAWSLSSDLFEVEELLLLLESSSVLSPVGHQMAVESIAAVLGKFEVKEC